MRIFSKRREGTVRITKKWLHSATDKQLADAYEERRLKWLYNNNGNKTPEMIALDREMLKRSEARWEKDPRRHPGYQWSDKNRWE